MRAFLLFSPSHEARLRNPNAGERGFGWHANRPKLLGNGSGSGTTTGAAATHGGIRSKADELYADNGIAECYQREENDMRYLVLMQFDDVDASGKAGAEIKGQIDFQWELEEVLRH